MKQLVWLPAVLLLLTSPLALASTVTVIVSGLGGNTEYAEKFERYADEVANVARAAAKSPQDVILIRGDAAKRNVIMGVLENLPVSNNSDVFLLYLIVTAAMTANYTNSIFPDPISPVMRSSLCLKTSSPLNS